MIFKNIICDSVVYNVNAFVMFFISSQKYDLLMFNTTFVWFCSF